MVGNKTITKKHTKTNKTLDIINKELNTEEYWGQYYRQLSNQINEIFGKHYRESQEKFGDDFDVDLLEVEINNQNVTMETEYSLMVTEEIGYKNYWKVLKYCLDNNIDSVCDIGIASAWQSDMFLKNNIEYNCIDLGTDFNIRNNTHPKLNYIQGEYPLDIGLNKNVLGIAILSLGWGTYVGDNTQKVINQFSKLSQDFNQSLVYIPKKIIKDIKPLFSNIKEISHNLYLLESKDIK